MKWVAGVTVGLIVLLAGVIYGVNRALVVIPDNTASSPQYQNNKFVNPTPIVDGGIGTFITILKRSMTEERPAPVPTGPLPVDSITTAKLETLSEDTIHFVKLGHSTILLKVFGEYWLTDPMFGQRASPFSFMGPKRFAAPAMTIAQLPPIDRVLLSHNHYDHLDKDSIIVLQDKTKHFYVPLGVAAQLTQWGIDPAKVEELDWHDSRTVTHGKVTLTPSHHFSGRGLTDRNQTLWGSWSIEVRGKRVFFSGDSGYFDGFKQIGQQYGPFDLVFMENGAYSTSWPEVHMFPAQSVQAFKDLQGRYLVPIHNSTFDLAFHDWDAPLNQISQQAEQQHVALLTPRFGQIMSLDDPASTTRWWTQVQ